MSEAVRNKGWSVTMAGIGINLALGVLYAWSVFKGAIAESITKGGEGAFAWDMAKLNDPYALCCLVFAFSMILAGKCQDKIGPKWTAMIGGLLVGIGFIWISQTTSYAVWALGFGVLAGAGIGFGYSAATPPALKWFPAAKTGLIAGLVVSGFGLASVYIAPLSKYLVGTVGLQKGMMILGVAFLVVVCVLSTFLKNPPKGYVPAGASAAKSKAPVAENNVAPMQMLRSGSFWKLWFIYFIGAGAGLMVIGNVGDMAKKSLGEAAFIAVAIMAIGNAAGRVVAGILSDKIGRSNTLLIMLVLQALMMAACIPIVGSQNSSALLLVLLATFIGFNYGTNLSLFPAFSKNMWGLKNFGINYGLLFTAWGVGGFVMSRLSQMVMGATGSFSSSFMIAGTLLVIGAMFTMTLKPRAAVAPLPGVMYQPALGATMADGGEKVKQEKK
ncbi:MAG: OFA family MFS transporter [Deltaproteobacteria bacterium]|nr:OFA family MFS transporter [Deltaproteobacteria bacterium]